MVRWMICLPCPWTMPSQCLPGHRAKMRRVCFARAPKRPPRASRSIEWSGAKLPSETGPILGQVIDSGESRWINSLIQVNRFWISNIRWLSRTGSAAILPFDAIATWWSAGPGCTEVHVATSLKSLVFTHGNVGSWLVCTLHQPLGGWIWPALACSLAPTLKVWWDLNFYDVFFFRDWSLLAPQHRHAKFVAKWKTIHSYPLIISITVLA